MLLIEIYKKVLHVLYCAFGILQNRGVSPHKLEPGSSGRELEQQREELPAGQPEQQLAR